MIQAITFDAAGTLIQVAEPVGITYARIAAEHGFTVDPDTLSQAFRTVWKRTPHPFSDESPPDSDERDWWYRLVRAIFAEAHCPLPTGSQYDSFFDALYVHYEEPGAWLLIPGAERVVSRVAEQYRCAILSNFDSRLRRILKDLGLIQYFDPIFLSGEQKLSKPDLRLYQRIAENLALPPSQILHVGDDPICDWHGAVAAGFQVFRIGHEENDISELLQELSLA